MINNCTHFRDALSFYTNWWLLLLSKNMLPSLTVQFTVHTTALHCEVNVNRLLQWTVSDPFILLEFVPRFNYNNPLYDEEGRHQYCILCISKFFLIHLYSLSTKVSMYSYSFVTCQWLFRSDRTSRTGVVCVLVGHLSGKCSLGTPGWLKNGEWEIGIGDWGLGIEH